MTYKYDFCFFVATYRGDYHFAKICCESIRHFYPKTPIIVLQDGDFSLEQLRKLGHIETFDDNMTDEVLRGLEGAFGKLKLLANQYSRRFLYLDADTVLIGKILDLPFKDFDFYMSPIYYDLETKEDQGRLLASQFDPEKIMELDPEYVIKDNNLVLYCTGMWFGTSHALDLSNIEYILQRYAASAPNDRRRISSNYEQGLLTYMLSRAAMKGTIKVGVGEFEIGPTVERATRYPDLTINAVKERSYTKLYLLHFSRPRRRTRLRQMVFGDIPFMFNSRYYSRFPWHVKIADDTNFILTLMRVKMAKAIKHFWQVRTLQQHVVTD